MPTCCEEDCCDPGTMWTGTTCVNVADSTGFNGTHASTYETECAARICCELGCCGTGTTFDESIGCCKPEDPPAEPSKDCFFTLSVVLKQGGNFAYNGRAWTPQDSECKATFEDVAGRFRIRRGNQAWIDVPHANILQPNVILFAGFGAADLVEVDVAYTTKCVCPEEPPIVAIGQYSFKGQNAMPPDAQNPVITLAPPQKKMSCKEADQENLDNFNELMKMYPQTPPQGLVEVRV